MAEGADEDVLHFEFFFGNELFEACFHGNVSWIEEPWRCPGLDPTLFAHRFVPLKEASPGLEQAMKYFA